MSSPPFSARANALVQRIEHWLEHRLSALPDDRTRLPEAMRYATLNGGKRLRPLLVYASGEALGLVPDRLDGAAAAVELFTATRWCTTTCRPWTTTTCAAASPPRILPLTRQRPFWRATPCRRWRLKCWPKAASLRRPVA